MGEATERSLAASSRFCTGTLTYPDPARDPEGFAGWLSQLGRAHPGAVLMPMTDITTPLAIQHAPPGGALLTALPSLEAYERASDKYQLFLLAREAGLKVPRTEAVSRTTAGTVTQLGLRYPVVVKPRTSAMRTETGTVKRTVRYAHSAQELVHLVESMLLNAGDELLLQEYIDGFGAGVFALYDHGAPKFFFAHRRIREKPPSGGVSVLCESAPLTPAAVDAAQKLLEPLRWHGVAMVEFKIDGQGIPWLIEINARLWGSLQLAVDAGADFPWALYSIASGNGATLPSGYSIGKRLRWWLGDLDNLYASLRSRRVTPTLGAKLRAIGSFLVPWQPGLRYEFLRSYDPLPAAAAVRQYFQQTFSGKK